MSFQLYGIYKVYFINLHVYLYVAVFIYGNYFVYMETDIDKICKDTYNLSPAFSCKAISHIPKYLK